MDFIKIISFRIYIWIVKKLGTLKSVGDDDDEGDDNDDDFVCVPFFGL